jgi:phage terminase small subunit
MSTPGRRPKPAHVKKAEGQPGHRPIPDAAQARISVIRDVPEPPSDLAESGQEAWNLLGGSLAKVGALQDHYLPLLRQFAVAVEMAEKAKAELDEGDLVRKGAGGAVRIRPFRCGGTPWGWRSRSGAISGPLPRTWPGWDWPRSRA